MNDLSLEIPMSIFAAGCIICLLSALSLFSLPTTQAMYVIGLSIGLFGIVTGLITFIIYKMMGKQRQGN